MAQETTKPEDSKPEKTKQQKAKPRRGGSTTNPTIQMIVLVVMVICIALIGSSPISVPNGECAKKGQPCMI